MTKAKKAATKKSTPKKVASKASTKKAAPKKSGTAKKNKNGVKNSLVNNIRPKRKKELQKLRASPLFIKKLIRIWKTIGVKKNESVMN